MELTILGLFVLFAVMYHIGHKEYNRRYPQKNSEANELENLSLKVTQMDEQIQSLKVKVEALEKQTNKI